MSQETAAAPSRLAYSISELAVGLGVAPNTIRKEINAGRLKVLRLGTGRTIRISVTALAEWEATYGTGTPA